MADNSIKSLKEVFSNHFFRIPDYQRGYAWERSQLEDFWDDLYRLKDKDVAIHYTGLLTVEKVDRTKVEHLDYWEDDRPFFIQGMSAFYVVDGQQRLTTSIILIKAILERIDDNQQLLFKNRSHWESEFLYENYNDNFTYRFGYIKDMPSYEFFKTKIFDHQSSQAALVPEETLYTNNLKDALEFFRTMLKDLSFENMEKVFDKTINALKFNFYEIDNDLDVFVAFETMNNRGKPLSKLELLKNRLIYLSTLLNENGETSGNRLRKTITDCWKTVYEYLGKKSERSLLDDDFLRDHWIMYFPEYNRKEAGAFSKFLLNKHFITRKVDNESITQDMIKKYALSVQESIKSWYFLFNPIDSGYSPDVINMLERMNRLGFGAFRPLIMSALSKEKNNMAKLVDLLKACERFNFLIFRLSRRRSNTGNSHFYGEANKYHDGIQTIEKITEDIKAKTDQWFSALNFKSYIIDEFKNRNAYYSWNGLKYFLYEYEKSLQPKTGSQKMSWDEVDKERSLEETIEHIYPQTPEADYWKEEFQEYIVSEHNKTLINSLGNLLLLSRKKNSEQSRRSFPDKCSRGKGNNSVGYFNGSYSEIRVNKEYQEWTPTSIMNRGKELFKFMEENWEISLGTQEQKLQLLHLGFLETDNLGEVE